MSKYYVYLADNYTKSEPFITEWDYELIGDKLRAEFDEYFAKEEERQNAGAGKTKQLFRGEYVKRFMITKRVNLIDNPANGNLKSVFVLRKEEKKTIDGRAKGSLARFEYKMKRQPDGTYSDPTGFLKFEVIEGEENAPKDEKTFKIEGNDIEYFQEEAEIEEKEQKIEEIIEKETKKEEKEEFECEICGKSFDSNRALHAHSLVHKKDK